MLVRMRSVSFACCALNLPVRTQGLKWAADLKALLLEMKEAADEAREHGLATLHPLEVQDWQAQFIALVTQADATTPTAQPPPRHQRTCKTECSTQRA